MLRASCYKPHSEAWTGLPPKSPNHLIMAAPPDAVAAKLQKQLEYYFSDANLRRDAHLKGLAGANDDAALRQWVDLEHVLAFSRARAILNESTTDGEPATKRAKTEIPAVALEAVRASSSIELSECGTKIRRGQPYVAVDACVEINQ